MRITRKKRGLLSADLTPMIDVIFQLILFFMVSTTFINNKALKVELPESETAQAVEITGIVLSVDAGGRMLFNDERVSFKDISAKLDSFPLGGKKAEDIPVTLEADKKVTTETIVKLFDIFRKSGFVTVSLRTKS